MNALAREKSPYLRQHQSNPVDWLPWGDAAFARAQAERKPVLLSVGYAACHWCHVMARESFDDAATAAMMNARFVNVKVDREERPDVDAIYVRALQAMGRRAGWPLTMFLTPDAKPFWGGTYFPPERRGPQPSFREVLEAISDAYQSNRETAQARAASLIDSLADAGHESSADLPAGSATAAVQDLLRSMDPVNGGMQGAPKFPYPALLRFLWNEGRRSRRDDFQRAAERSLEYIIRGGIFDHVGGGFARYAVDTAWQVPHFEKMLYDNALLAGVLTEVWRANRSPLFRDAIERTIGWMLRELKLPGGAFACSLEAESGGVEGGFYLWADAELDALLGADAAFFKRAYGVTSEGHFAGRHVLHRATAPESLTDTEETALARCRATLFEARAARAAPRRDDKVLADWNGMAISTLAQAGAVFDAPAWIEAAASAFEFVRGNMLREGELGHSWCEGELSAASILDDYAHMARAALSLHEVTGGTEYLACCTDWIERCARRFAAPNGAFYHTPEGPLVARICDGLDTVTPSGNGVMAQVLSRLYYLTGEDRYRAQGSSIVRAFAANAERDSFQLATLLDASRFLDCAVQIAIVGERSGAATRDLARAVWQHPGPDNVAMVVAPGTTLPPHHPAAAKVRAARPAAYVCAGTTCSLPVFDFAALCATLDAQSTEALPQLEMHEEELKC